MYLQLFVFCCLLCVFTYAETSYAEISQPCSLRLSAYTIPVIYDGDPRNNPDGTYYPGDTFFYIIRYAAGPSCVSFSLDSIEHTHGISLDFNRVTSHGAPHIPDGDPYVDSSENLRQALYSRCNSDAQYFGCVFGKATILYDPDCSDLCIDSSQSIVQSATAIKRVCYYVDGSIRCKNVPITRTVTITPQILAPQLHPKLFKEILKDTDGYDARNLDGTYYLWDPVTLRHVPELKWKEHRQNTIHFDVEKKTRLHHETNVLCKENSCTLSLEHPGFETSTWDVENEDELDIYNATDSSLIGLHEITYDVKAWNNDVLLDSESASIDALVVQYEPVYSEYPYSVLSDKMRTSFENRAGVALHYFGSLGGGSDDVSKVHEDRRSKINDYVYFGVGFDPWIPRPFNDTLEWSEALDVGVLPDHQHADNTVPSEFENIPCEIKEHETAMLVRAGYCKIYFEYDILDTVIGPIGPRYENATLFNTLISRDFAGAKNTYLSHYEYRFSESLFSSNLHIKADKNVPLRVDVFPNNDTIHLPQYVYDKVLHDSKDSGLATIVSDDIYDTEYTESSSGQIDIKLRRVSSLFEEYQNNNDNLANLHITELAPLYIDHSRAARLEVPLDVGFGALSPVIVTIHVGNNSKQFEYDFENFETDKEIQINLSEDNLLEIKRYDGITVIKIPDDFGRVKDVYVDSKILDIPCDAGCTINTPSNDVLEIMAVNEWGGSAHAIAEQFIPEETAPVPVSNGLVLVPFVLFMIVIYWVYRRISAS